MPRKVDKRKPETIIRELKDARKLAAANWSEFIRVSGERNAYRDRASKAESDRDEWKRRFDALLAAIPELRKVQG